MGYIQWPFMLRGSLMNDEQPSGTKRTPEQEAAPQRHLRYQTRQRKGQPSPAAAFSFTAGQAASLIIGIVSIIAGIVVVMFGMDIGLGAFMVCVGISLPVVSAFLKSKRLKGIRIALAGLVLILVGIVLFYGFVPFGGFLVLIGVLFVIVGFAVQIARMLTLWMGKD